MSLVEILKSLVMTILSAMSTLYVWHIVLERKIEWRSKRFWFITVGLVAMISLNYYMMNNFVKVASITLILALACSYMFKENLKTGVVTALTSQLLIMIAETVFVTIIAIIFNSDGSFIETTQFETILANAFISVLVILLAQFKWVKKINQFLLKTTRHVNNINLIVLMMFFILLLNIVTATAYYRLDYKIMQIFNIVTMVIFFAIIINSLKNKNDYIEVSDKYNTTVTSLKEYEVIVKNYRLSSHENKNQLLTIRNMIKNEEKDIPDYIDKIVKNELKDDEYLKNQSKIIPEGGLRGLIYSKMLVMKSKEIEFDFSIDKAISTVELIKLGEETVLDICKIIGVFLDNAIEAVGALEEKFIDLEMSIENKRLSISVTNNYEGTIPISEIENQGYTTKGEGHGYGLALVKKLIDENQLLKNEKYISSDEFTQCLVIDISQLK